MSAVEQAGGVDLGTIYLGLRLPHPIVAGASPLSEDLDGVRRLEDAGSALITLPSLFEEQLAHEQMVTLHATLTHDHASAEASSFFPSSDRIALGPHNYLEHLRRVKQAVRVPVVASLNGSTPGGWLDYARLLQQAGADALELNLYTLATDPAASGAEMEDRAVEIVRTVKAAVRIPVAVKLSPFYSSLAHFGRRLCDAGADGLVLFNRFYQPDIDVEKLEALRTLQLSHPSELRLRLLWLAVLSARIQTSYAVTGGVHDGVDAVKAIMAGAHAVQMVSALLLHGPGRLAAVREDVRRFLADHEYASVEQMRGSMNLRSVPDPAAFERANYMFLLHSWRGSKTPPQGLPVTRSAGE